MGHNPKDMNFFKVQVISISNMGLESTTPRSRTAYSTECPKRIWIVKTHENLGHLLLILTVHENSMWKVMGWGCLKDRKILATFEQPAKKTQLCYLDKCYLPKCVVLIVRWFLLVSVLLGSFNLAILLCSFYHWDSSCFTLQPLILHPLQNLKVGINVSTLPPLICSCTWHQIRPALHEFKLLTMYVVLPELLSC